MNPNPNPGRTAATLSIELYSRTQCVYVVRFPNGDVVSSHSLAAALREVRRAACAVAGRLKAGA
jgi:hypothetical protein